MEKLIFNVCKSIWMLKKKLDIPRCWNWQQPLPIGFIWQFFENSEPKKKLRKSNQFDYYPVCNHSVTQFTGVTQCHPIGTQFNFLNCINDMEKLMDWNWDVALVFPPTHFWGFKPGTYPSWVLKVCKSIWVPKKIGTCLNGCWNWQQALPRGYIS